MVYDQPHSLRPIFPPGNTGPYVYLNGMQAQMRVIHGWPRTVFVPRVRDLDSVPPDAVTIRLRITDDRVVFEPPDPLP